MGGWVWNGPPARHPAVTLRQLRHGAATHGAHGLAKHTTQCRHGFQGCATRNVQQQRRCGPRGRPLHRAGPSATTGRVNSHHRRHRIHSLRAHVFGIQNVGRTPSGRRHKPTPRYSSHAHSRAHVHNAKPQHRGYKCARFHCTKTDQPTPKPRCVHTAIPVAHPRLYE